MKYLPFHPACRPG